MNAEQKKEFLVNKLMTEIDPVELGLTISSPKIKGARIIVAMKKPLSQPSVLKPAEEIDPTALEQLLFTTIQPDTPSEQSTGRGSKDTEELTAKERYKRDKMEAKEKKKEERAFQKMRKDAKKRGFGTGVLYELDDPADIYDLTDEEVKQIEFAGIINSDGFYSFKDPDDAGDLYREPKSKKTVIAVGCFIAVIIILTVIFINNIASIF